MGITNLRKRYVPTGRHMKSPKEITMRKARPIHLPLSPNFFINQKVVGK